jgi:hypothetical protein
VLLARASRPGRDVGGRIKWRGDAGEFNGAGALPLRGVQDCGGDPFPSVCGLGSAAQFRVVSSAHCYLECVDAGAVCLDQSIRGAPDVRVVEFTLIKMQDRPSLARPRPM